MAGPIARLLLIDRSGRIAGSRVRDACFSTEAVAIAFGRGAKPCVDTARLRRELAAGVTRRGAPAARRGTARRHRNDGEETMPWIS